MVWKRVTRQSSRLLVVAAVAGLFVGLGVSVSACRDSESTMEPEARCERDSDCRQGQVCADATCTEAPVGQLLDTPPPPTDARLGDGVAREAPHPSWTWRRGGPGLPLSATVRGPVSAPEVVWEQSLGAAISASPRLITRGGEVHACVGAHQGRFVCAVVEGARAGTLSLDLQLDGIVWGTAAVGPGPDDGVRLYVGTDADTLHAIEPASGAILWSRRLGRCDPPRALGPMGVRCDVDGGPTVASDGGLLVGADGVYRVERDGAITWRFDGAPVEDGTTDENPDETKSAKKKSAKKSATKTKKKNKKNAKTEEEETLPPAKIEHVFAAPVITARGDIVVGTQGAGLIALDSEGRERWRVELVGDVDSAPAIGRDGSLYVGDDGGRLVAVSARGQVRWIAELGGPVRSAVTLDAYARSGKRSRASSLTERIYVTTLAGSLHAFSSRGESLWVLEVGAPIQATPAVDGEGTLFFGDQDERLYAVTRAGDVRWRIDLPADVDSSVAISPGGRLVFGADDGMLRAVADPTAPVDR